MKKFLLDLLKDYKKNICIILFFAVLHAFSSIGLVYIGKIILDTITTSASFIFIIWLGCELFIVNLVNQGLGALTYYRSYFLNISIEKDVQIKTLQKFQKLPYFRIIEEKGGKLQSIIGKGTDTLGRLAEQFFGKIVQNSIMIILSTAMLFFVHWSIPVVIIVFFIPLFTIISIYDIRSRMSKRKDLEEEQNHLSGQTNEFIKNIRDIRTFSKESTFINLFDTQMGSIFGKKKELSILSHTMNFRQVFCTHITNTLLIIITSYLILFKGLSVGNYILVFGLFMSIRSSLWDIVFLYRDFEEGSVKVQNLVDFFGWEEKTQFVEDNYQKFSSLSLENISFFHGENQILHKLFFALQAKEKIAIIGESGKGKTTLVSILLGLNHISNGQLRFNNENTFHFPQSLFSYVPQDTQVFNESIRFNLSFLGDYSDSSMESILEKVGLGYLGLRDKDKNLLDIRIGNDGLKLSGGEKQRLGIARALLRDAPIFIFDEVTSNLDTETEKLIISLLFEIAKEKTMIIISHKKEILKHVDTIYELSEGVLKKV